jgi:hypothetical protein
MKTNKLLKRISTSLMFVGGCGKLGYAKNDYWNDNMMKWWKPASQEYK